MRGKMWFTACGVIFFLPIFMCVVKYKMLLLLSFRSCSMNRRKKKMLGKRIPFRRRSKVCQDSLKIVGEKVRNQMYSQIKR